MIHHGVLKILTCFQTVCHSTIGYCSALARALQGVPSHPCYYISQVLPCRILPELVRFWHCRLGSQDIQNGGIWLKKKRMHRKKKMCGYYSMNLARLGTTASCTCPLPMHAWMTVKICILNLFSLWIYYQDLVSKPKHLDFLLLFGRRDLVHQELFLKEYFKNC